jgi:hypothetical protein
VLGSWIKHNKILARGDPPLTQKVVDASLALTRFVAMQSGQPVPQSAVDDDQYAANVAARYAASPAAAQLKFSLVAPLWYQVQYEWSKMPESQRSKIRAQLQASASASQPAAGNAAAGGNGGASGETAQQAGAMVQFQKAWNNEEFQREFMVKFRRWGA